MFSSSLFHIKRRRLHIKFIRYYLVKMKPQYVVAMAHQEVFQQQIIINQLIRGGSGGEEEPERSTSNLAKTKDASRVTSNLASIISSRLC